jgi:hypothetical protein
MSTSTSTKQTTASAILAQTDKPQDPIVLSTSARRGRRSTKTDSSHTDANGNVVIDWTDPAKWARNATVGVLGARRTGKTVIEGYIMRKLNLKRGICILGSSEAVKFFRRAGIPGLYLFTGVWPEAELAEIVQFLDRRALETEIDPALDTETFILLDDLSSKSEVRCFSL